MIPCSLLQSRLLRAMLDRVIACAVLLLFLFCVAARLQSRLITAAEQWQEYRASMMQRRKQTFSSRTNTTAMRTIAADAAGNKGGNPSPSSGLQISGASVIGGLLQTICRQCYLKVCLTLQRLLQRICQIMRRYYAKIAMKLIISVLCHATKHFHMVHATGVGSVPPFKQCLHASRALYILL